MSTKEDKFSSIAFFPWDQGKDPDWVNPENGYMWYVDYDMTDYANNPDKSTGKPLNAICFYVCSKDDNDGVQPVSRVLIDRKSNDVLHDDTSLEGMAIKIDMFRFIKD